MSLGGHKSSRWGLPPEKLNPWLASACDALPRRWRLFANAEISEDENGADARIIFNQRRIRRFIMSARLPLSLLSRIGQKMPPRVFLKPLRFVTKRILVNPQDIRNPNANLLFVISEKRIGFISPADSGRVKFTSVVPLLAAYERLSASVPVALDDISDFGTGSEIRLKSRRNPISPP
jgi:hypothetical protein